jgi:hypothetical protein
MLVAQVEDTVWYILRKSKAAGPGEDQAFCSMCGPFAGSMSVVPLRPFKSSCAFLLGISDDSLDSLELVCIFRAEFQAVQACGGLLRKWMRDLDSGYE